MATRRGRAKATAKVYGTTLRMGARNTRGRAKRAGGHAAHGLGLGQPRMRPGVDAVTQMRAYNQRRAATYGIAAIAGTYAARSVYRKGKAEYNRRKKRKGAYRRRRDSTGKFR